MLHDHERNDVAGGGEVFFDIKKWTEVLDILTRLWWWGLEIPITYFFCDAISHVGEFAVSATDIPTAPAFREWAGCVDEGGAKLEDWLTVLIGLDRADHEAGDVLGLGVRVAGEAGVVTADVSLFHRRHGIECVKHDASGVICGGNFNEPTGDVTNIEVVVKIDRTRVARGDERALFACF